MLDSVADKQVRPISVLTTFASKIVGRFSDLGAERALFEGFARKRGLPLTRAEHFTRETHFAGQHDTEWLVTISLLNNSQEQHAKEDI